MMVETKMRPLKEARSATMGRLKFSKVTGIDTGSVYRYEAGLTTPGLAQAAKIARALGVRLDEIEEFAPLAREIEAAGYVFAAEDE